MFLVLRLVERNPLLANCRAVLNPMPLELPVTRATFRDFIIILIIKMEVNKLTSDYMVSD